MASRGKMRNGHEISLRSQYPRQLHDVPRAGAAPFLQSFSVRVAATEWHHIRRFIRAPRCCSLRASRDVGCLCFAPGRQNCLPLRAKAGPSSLRSSEHGDVLGLNATISNRPYEVTAEMVEPGQANFIPSDALLQFLHDYEEVALRVAQQLSRSYYSAHEEICTLGLANSPQQKLAKLLLGWSAERGDSSHSPQLHLVLTHEEIGERSASPARPSAVCFPTSRRSNSSSRRVPVW